MAMRMRTRDQLGLQHARTKEWHMPDGVYRVTEIVGSSPDGVTEAIKVGATRAARTLHHLDWFEVTEIRGHFENDAIAHYQVTMKVGFRLEDTIG
jgi:flavin-binding protein dodecin